MNIVNKKFKPLFSFLLFLSLTACGYATLETNLNPQVQATPVVNGNNAPISLSVNDKRSTFRIGYRAFDHQGASVISTQNIAGLFSNQLQTMLRNNEFLVSSDAKTSLTVNVLKLQFDANDEGKKQSLKTETMINVIATRDGKTMERNYHGTYETSGFIVYPTDDMIQKNINQALSDVLTQLANDKGLWSFLGN